MGEDSVILVRSLRELLALSLDELDRAQLSDDAIAPAVDFDFVLDSNEFLRASWKHLVVVARVVAHLRRGDVAAAKATSLEIPRWKLERLGRDEPLVAAWGELEQASHEIDHVFDPNSEFRRLASDFRGAVRRSTATVSTLILGLHMISDHTVALAYLRDVGTRDADAILALNASISPNVSENRWPSHEPNHDCLMFDIAGLASWASALGLADLADVLAPLAECDLATEYPVADLLQWETDYIFGYLGSADRIVAFLGRFIEEKGLWPVIHGPRRKVEVVGDHLELVTFLPDWITDGDLDSVILEYARSLADCGREAEALAVLQHSASEKPVEWWEAQLVDQPDTGHDDSAFSLVARAALSALMVASAEAEVTMSELRAYVRGVLDERRRLEEASPNETLASEQYIEIRESQKRTEAMTRAGSATSMAVAQEIRGMRVELGAVGELVLDAQNERRQLAAQAEEDRRHRDLRDELLRAWQRTVVANEESRTEQEARDLVGEAAWALLMDDTKREVLSYSASVRNWDDRFAYQAGRSLGYALEGELAAALGRAKLESAGNLGEVVNRAWLCSVEDLSAIGGLALKSPSLVDLRNKAAHPGPAFTPEDLKQMAWRLFAGGDPEKGLLARVVMCGRGDAPTGGPG